MKVKDLKANSVVDEMLVQVITKDDVRTFVNARGEGKVCNAFVQDEDDQEITLTLWNDDIDKFKAGDIIKITKGWVSEYKGRLQLSAGKGGKLEVYKE